MFISLFLSSQVDVPPPPPPGISLEEADELKASIEKLENETTELRAELAAKEDTNKKLSTEYIRKLTIIIMTNIKYYEVVVRPINR